MGSPITGREVTIAVKKGSAWRTAVLLGALDGLLVKVNSLTKSPELLPDQPLGVGFETSTAAGKSANAGSLDGELRFDGNEWLLIAMAMGQAGTPTQIGATLAYQHTLQLTAGNFGYFATMAQKMKSDLVFEWPSVKPGSFTIKAGKLVPATFTIAVVAAGLSQNSGSGTNDQTTIATVTYRDNKNRVILDANAYLRINAQGGSALSGSDNLYVAEWELAFGRPIEGDHVLDQTELITEPVGTEFTTAELTVRFPQFVDGGASLIAALGTNPPTAYKIELFAYGGVAASSEHYRMRVQCPQAFISGPSPTIPGPGKIPHEIKFRLTTALSAPSGMSGVTNPFAIRLVNTRNSDYLS